LGNGFHELPALAGESAMWRAWLDVHFGVRRVVVGGISALDDVAVYSTCFGMAGEVTRRLVGA
jgi:hypothetical protein